MEKLQQQLDNFKGYLNGRYAIDNDMKYSLVCIGTALIHIFLSIRFASLNYTILFFYNVLSVIFYIYMATSFLKKKNYFAMFTLIYIEVLLHSCAATLLAGRDWGFLCYNLALPPVSFYLFYTMPNFERKLKTPMTFTLISLGSIVATRIMTNYISPIYTYRGHDYTLTYAYCFNIVVSCLMVVLFSVLFSIDTRRSELYMIEQNRLLSMASSTDPLTKLMNRRKMDEYLNEILDHAKKSGKRFSLILGDIDDFKKVNDTYGHNIGDDVLVGVADTIIKNTPETCRVCRWGGEEILIMVPAELKETINIAERIRESVALLETKTETSDESTGSDILHITMTFGVAEYIPGYPINKIVSIADDNLYRGKKAGKNQVSSALS